jgi:DNA-binding GntR family transcriptional regulator
MEMGMHEELIGLMTAAARAACTGLTSPRLAVLQASVDQACAIPAALSWDRKAGAHAEFLNALADADSDPWLAPALSSGAGLAYDLMIAAGRVADSIVINSRKRMLDHLRAGNTDAAALEMENHLKVLSFMGRLAAVAELR